MKHLFALVLILLALTPGCRKKTTSKATTVESIPLKKEEPATPNLKQKKDSIFVDEDVDKFVLKEEEKDQQAEEKTKEETDIFAPENIKDNKETVTIFEEEEAADREVAAQKNIDQRASGFKTIYFDFDKFDLRKDQAPSLNHNLSIVKALTNEGKTIVIKGHTCHFGSDTHNIPLSEKRATAVYNWLVKNGISKSNLKKYGCGSEECTVPRGTREEEAPNRRSELAVLPIK